jgi:hypothetical protein
MTLLAFLLYKQPPHRKICMLVHRGRSPQRPAGATSMIVAIYCLSVDLLGSSTSASAQWRDSQPLGDGAEDEGQRYAGDDGCDERRVVRHLTSEVRSERSGATLCGRQPAHVPLRASRMALHRGGSAHLPAWRGRRGSRGWLLQKESHHFGGRIRTERVRV